MRLTALILSLLILVLSCLPCADIDAMPASVTGTVVATTTQHQQHQKQEEGRDLCSPFCHCSCCSVFSVLHIPLRIPVLVPLPVCITHAIPPCDAVIDISLPVWQPPRLV
jgi:hypothetical protein